LEAFIFTGDCDSDPVLLGEVGAPSDGGCVTVHTTSSSAEAEQWYRELAAGQVPKVYYRDPLQDAAPFDLATATAYPPVS
jgi:hypothetical protein